MPVNLLIVAKLFSGKLVDKQAPLEASAKLKATICTRLQGGKEGSTFFIIAKHLLTEGGRATSLDLVLMLEHIHAG